MACMQKRLGPRYRMQIHLKSVQRSVPFPTLAHTWYWIIQTEHAVYAQHHAYRLDSLRYSLRVLHARYACKIFPHKSPGTQPYQRDQRAWWQQLGHLRLGQTMPTDLVTRHNCLSQTLAPLTVDGFYTVLNHAAESVALPWPVRGPHRQRGAAHTRYDRPQSSVEGNIR